MNSILRTHATNYNPKTCQTVKSFPKKQFNSNSRNNAFQNPASHFNSFLFPSYPPSDSRKLNNSTKTRKSLINSDENMADVQLQPAPQQIRRPKLRRKGTNKTSSVSKVTTESVLPPDITKTTNRDVEMNQNDSTETIQIEVSTYNSKSNSSNREPTTPNRARHKKSHPQLQQKPNPQDSHQQNQQNNTYQTPPPKQSPPKNSRTNSKNYNNEYSSPPLPNQQTTTLNGNNSQKRRGRRNKQQSALTLNSTPTANSGSSGDETSLGSISSGLPPRPKSQHIRTESLKPTLQRRLSSPEIPLSPQPIHTPQKPTFYAGACFEKSPAPSALPIPLFSSRQTSLASSLPTQSHARAATTDNRPAISNEHRIHPSTSTPLLHLSFDPVYISPDIYSTPVANRSNVPQHTPTPLGQNRAYNKTPEMFIMDEEEKNQEKELRKRSRDLLTLLGAARDVPDTYTHEDKTQWTPQQEWVDNGVVLEQIGRNLKDLLKIQG